MCGSEDASLLRHWSCQIILIKTAALGVLLGKIKTGDSNGQRKAAPEEMLSLALNPSDLLGDLHCVLLAFGI